MRHETVMLIPKLQKLIKEAMKKIVFEAGGPIHGNVDEGVSYSVDNLQLAHRMNDIVIAINSHNSN